MPSRPPAPESPPSEGLESLARAALDVAKKARRNKKNLAGDNFYGNKIAALRADATNAFRALAAASVGDSSALAELMESVFSASTRGKERLAAYRQLSCHLRTSVRAVPAPREDEGLFPLSVLAQARRGYLVTVGRQMNGCFTTGWHDAAAVMMRRLIEIVIVEAFEARGLAATIKDANGNYLQLSDLVTKALAEPSWTLSRNSRKALPGLRDIGHMSAHGRYFCARKDDLEALRPGCRVVVEEFLHHARLL